MQDIEVFLVPQCLCSRLFCAQSISYAVLRLPSGSFLRVILCSRSLMSRSAVSCGHLHSFAHFFRRLSSGRDCLCSIMRARLVSRCHSARSRAEASAKAGKPQNSCFYCSGSCDCVQDDESMLIVTRATGFLSVSVRVSSAS